MSSNPSSTNRQLPRYRLGRAAFSIVELLMMVAVISVLTGIAITIFYNDSGAVNRASLKALAARLGNFCGSTGWSLRDPKNTTSASLR